MRSTRLGLKCLAVKHINDRSSYACRACDPLLLLFSTNFDAIDRILRHHTLIPSLVKQDLCCKSCAFLFDEIESMKGRTGAPVSISDPTQTFWLSHPVLVGTVFQNSTQISVWALKQPHYSFNQYTLRMSI